MRQSSGQGMPVPPAADESTRQALYPQGHGRSGSGNSASTASSDGRRARRRVSSNGSGPGVATMGNNIESSVTKLLVETKRLLETLTAWSKSQASDEDVSNVYVRLGNEFNVSQQAFVRAGIDMQDLESVPDDLRHVLELTLSQDPSPYSLERYLPRVRDVIVKLLQGLKSKQVQHRIRSGERPIRRQQQRENYGYTSPRVASFAEANSRTQIMPPPVPQPPMPVDRPPIDMSQPRLPSGGAGARDPITALQDHSALERRASKRYSAMAFQQLSGEPASPVQRSSRLSVEDVRTRVNTTPRDSPSLDGVDEVIDEDGAAETAPSQDEAKPAQEGQLEAAPATTTTTTTILSTPPKARRTASLVSRLGSNSPIKPFVLYCERPGSPITKVVVTPPVTAASILATVRGKFGDATIQVEAMQACDPQSTFVYQLESMDSLEQLPSGAKLIMGKDGASDDLTSIRQTLAGHGEILKLLMARVAEAKAGETVTLNESRKDEALEDPALKSQDNSQDKILDGVQGKILEDNLDKTQDKNLKEPDREVGALNEDETKPESPDTDSTNAAGLKGKDVLLDAFAQSHGRGVKDLQHELGVLRQSVASLGGAFTTELQAIMQQCATMRTVTEAKPSEARAYIDNAKSKLELDMGNVAEAMTELNDTVEGMREDVLQRKIRLSQRTIDSVRAEAQRVRDSISELSQHVQRIEPVWSKLWETELDRIVQEQTLLQQNTTLVDDYDKDWEAAIAVLDNVQAVVDFQGKQQAKREYKPPTAGADDNTDPRMIRDLLHSEIKELRPDHESRVNAIDKAERVRTKQVRDRQNEFEEELGSFVGERKLRQAGGVDEVERARQMKEERLRKESFQSGPHETTQENEGSEAPVVSPVVTTSPSPSPAPLEVPETAEDTTPNEPELSQEATAPGEEPGITNPENEDEAAN